MGSFSLTRRETLIAAGAATAPPSAMAAGGTGQSVQSRKRPTMEGKALLNRNRAQEVMERFDIAGLIASEPMNVYYLSNVETIPVKFKMQQGGYATLGRDPQIPPHLISNVIAGYDIANKDRETAELIQVGFSGTDAVVYGADGLPAEPAGAKGFGYHVLSNVDLTDREKAWRDIHQKGLDNLAANAAWGVAKALKAQGVTKGRVAVDDMRIAELLKQTDLVNITCVPGYEIFQLIRMVKSEQELAYQKLGGWNNGEAVLAAIYAIERGMTVDDIDYIYGQECAKRGNRVSGLIVGLPGGGLPDGVIVEGKCYTIDGVSHYKNYHGDTARPFMLGEPDRVTKQRFHAASMAREAVFDALKPGTPFSLLRKIGFETMVKHGLPEHAISVTPHTVGLQHGDNPHDLSVFGIKRYDPALEENMVMTVDLPYIEIGWGIGHNEDLVRITKTGYELYSPASDPYIIL